MLCLVLEGGRGLGLMDLSVSGEAFRGTGGGLSCVVWS